MLELNCAVDGFLALALYIVVLTLLGATQLSLIKCPVAFSRTIHVVCMRISEKKWPGGSSAGSALALQRRVFREKCVYKTNGYSRVE